MVVYKGSVCEPLSQTTTRTPTDSDFSPLSLSIFHSLSHSLSLSLSLFHSVSLSISLSLSLFLSFSFSLSMCLMSLSFCPSLPLFVSLYLYLMLSLQCSLSLSHFIWILMYRKVSTPYHWSAQTVLVTFCWNPWTRSLVTVALSRATNDPSRGNRYPM